VIVSASFLTRLFYMYAYLTAATAYMHSICVVADPLPTAAEMHINVSTDANKPDYITLRGSSGHEGRHGQMVVPLVGHNYSPELANALESALLFCINVSASQRNGGNRDHGTLELWLLDNNNQLHALVYPNSQLPYPGLPLVPDSTDEQFGFTYDRNTVAAAAAAAVEEAALDSDDEEAELDPHWQQVASSIGLAGEMHQAADQLLHKVSLVTAAHCVAPPASH
jgi:hypothetical protein